MGYIIDTDVCIDLMRKRADIIDKIQRLDADLFLTFMSLSELFYGAYFSSRKEYQLGVIKAFIQEFTILTPNISSSELFGLVKANLRKEGQLIEDADLLIASIAIGHNLPLITHNTKHFDRLADFGLVLESW